jgi:hypothetical protein
VVKLIKWKQQWRQMVVGTQNCSIEGMVM